ncbi:gliding motility lipoprotein GldD [Eisenibacter elegans]|jgi:gliding motility-associated lipoprotein GldD|uniref:gliding motility lipoprotein GldD n=1 Tax=Eisenibacter elegans TaxID=997 RepID=UPI00041AF947|nr:gliding motility lipoprotein GldD [Eisenibacter elegans]
MRKDKRLGLSWAAVVVLLLFSQCGSPSYVPKPKAYNRIDLPVAAYQALASDTLPYQFEYSAYAHIRPDSSHIAEPTWIHIVYPNFQADIQITYKNIAQNPQYLQEYIDDAHKLTSKHQVKAYSIDETIIRTPLGKTAAVYEIEGDVPSQFQFYMTDSTNHFLRGAVYFRTSTKNDSLAPIIEFLKKDVLQLINTVTWR